MKDKEGSGKWTKQRLKAIFGWSSGWITAPTKEPSQTLL